MIKKLLPLLLLFTGMMQAQIVNIPDANFKNALLTHDPIIDTNGDGEIQLSEAAAATEINVQDKQIADLTGLEAFSNLIKLDCYSNNLTQLNLNALSHLEQLICANNQLTTLDVNGLTALLEVNCSENQIASLAISNLPELKYLSCRYNAMTSLNLSLPNLYSLDCGYNQLPGVFNVAECPNIAYLDCSVNQLVAINLPENHTLSYLGYHSNQFTHVDLNPQIASSINALGNPVTHLNIKNGQLEAVFQFPDFWSTLQYLCADEMDVPAFQAQIDLRPYCHAVINTYCSFTPGGNYNTISGTVRLDANNNGCDNSDSPSKNVKMKLNDGANDIYTYTRDNGTYEFFVPTGIYTVTPVFESADYYTTSPANATIDLITGTNVTEHRDFCINTSGNHPDVEVTLIPIDMARPGFASTYNIIYKNKGTTTASGEVNLYFNDSKIDYTYSTPLISSQQSDNLKWNYSNLAPNETRTLYVTFTLNTPTQDPPLDAGDLLAFSAEISLDGDEMPEDNYFEILQTIVNSMDPNDKTCLEGAVLAPEKIGEYLHYNINFENVGTASAINVVVKDAIDTEKFEITSLEITHNSHPMVTRINDGVVEFILQGINLPPSNGDAVIGHGNVAFKIKSKANLEVGNSVSNTADIFFDYNAPIKTNEAISTFTALAKTDFTKDATVTVAPNPTKSNIVIHAKNNIKSVTLFDIQGRILQTVSGNGNILNLDISNKQSGIYFLKVATANGSATEKIIKE